MKRGRILQVIVTSAAVSAILLLGSHPLTRATNQDRPGMSLAVPLYDRDPNHIWNRVHNSLLLRRSSDGIQYGSDVVDPLLWQNTKFLRQGRSRRVALQCLDEFLKTHAEKLITEPTKRAVFQHDLWAVFDWTASGGAESVSSRTLLKRIAPVMRRVALTPEQVSALPDTYAAAVAAHQFPAGYDPANPQRAFLPPDLLRPDGSWLCLTAYSAEPTAINHFSGRSRFLVFLRLPGGRQASVEYIRKLLDSPEPLFLPDTVPNIKLLNLRLPQLPAGTEVALLRQMIVIDAEGHLLPTPLTESVQLRVYHSVSPGSPYINYHNGPSSHDQDFFEFRLGRAGLFAQSSAGLRAVKPGETEFRALFSQGIDPFESSAERAWIERPGQILNSCPACHADSGIHSVQSRERWLGAPPRNRAFETDPSLSRTIKWETNETINRKQLEGNFKVMLQYWRDSG